MHLRKFLCIARKSMKLSSARIFERPAWHLKKLGTSADSRPSDCLLRAYSAIFFQEAYAACVLQTRTPRPALSLQKPIVKPKAINYWHRDFHLAKRLRIQEVLRFIARPPLNVTPDTRTLWLREWVRFEQGIYSLSKILACHGHSAVWATLIKLAAVH